jgi:hypothetical protein
MAQVGCPDRAHFLRRPDSAIATELLAALLGGGQRRLRPGRIKAASERAEDEWQKTAIPAATRAPITNGKSCRNGPLLEI